jgi:CDP-paratose 2-epimerase
MYGGNQHSTIDKGWIGWFCQKAIDIKNKTNLAKFTISGTGKQVRDVLHAKDVVSLYFTSVDKIDKIKGESFNIGGGINNSLSLLELFKFLEQELDIKMDFENLPERESDQLLFVADNSKINKLTGWEPKVNTGVGLRKMLDWLSK